MPTKPDLIPSVSIEKKIMLLRGQKVMMDSDLAALYGVETKALNRAVKRNLKRFPDDFMFQLDPSEAGALMHSRFQTGTLKRGQNIKYMPRAFTEQGVAMLSSVLHSPRAVSVNIEIMRAFVRIRQWLASNTELASKLAKLEKKYDAQFRVVFDAIRELMRPPVAPSKRIGFNAD